MSQGPPPVRDDKQKSSMQAKSRMRQTFSLFDLSSLSISSVAPAFSISATAGVMVADSGMYSVLGILLIALPFLISAYTFRMLNRHFPHAGASYHWSRRVLGPRAARFQGWILLLAYFTSIPPILVPAAQYTLALVDPSGLQNTWLQFAVATFWMAFALVPLLRGARPTALVTQIFFVIELIFLGAFAFFGIRAMPHIHVALGSLSFHLGGLLLTMVVASTIMDGWEIDSYASEESTNPHRDPGVGGIIGAIFALLIYLLFIPLVLLQTPRKLLVNSADPLVLWAHSMRAFMPPHASLWILIPVLASTAGSLWLTAYILIRGLFAMGRDGMIARWFGRLNRRGVPAVATWVIFAAAWAVMTLQLFVSSLGVFFNIVLSTAGFFLIFEFMLDNLTASIFLWRRHDTNDLHQRAQTRHAHRLMLVVSAFTTVYLLALLGCFLVVGAQTISPWVDVLLGLLIVAGILFARRKKAPTQSAVDIPFSGSAQSGEANVEA
ncbi:APC family permease [Alicyclobacillus sp. SP_1]|jgi:amino acid transporter|uniref:APC family permease n=1 Tax=Alicyclobacillus sp. SP_1 TaxID=2942475 RepID=UPI0021586534|nr:APC family permease [Alicyclobacillus sp. SP_1]